MLRNTGVKFEKFWLDKIAKTLCLSELCAASQRLYYIRCDIHEKTSDPDAPIHQAVVHLAD